jgi:hypothetical protein
MASRLGILPVRVGCLYIPLAILLLLGAGFVFLLQWDIPAPRSVIERVFPDDKFPR